jgi:hypothetical protein
MRLGGLHSRSGHGGEEKISLPCQKSNSDRPARSLVTILTELHKLCGYEMEWAASCRLRGESEKYSGSILLYALAAPVI